MFSISFKFLIHYINYFLSFDIGNIKKNKEALVKLVLEYHIVLHSIFYWNWIRTSSTRNCREIKFPLTTSFSILALSHPFDGIYRRTVHTDTISVVTFVFTLNRLSYAAFKKNRNSPIYMHISVKIKPALTLQLTPIRFARTHCDFTIIIQMIN